MKISLTPLQYEKLNTERIRTNHAYLSLPEFTEYVVADWLEGGLLLSQSDKGD